MSRIKKILSVLVAMVMVIAMVVPVAAIDATPTPKKPTAEDSAKVTVSNVEEDCTLTAYQIIDAAYDDNGFIGYVWATGMEKGGEKVNNPQTEVTDSLITGLAKNPNGLTKKESFVPTETPLEVGTWMILVTPKDNAEKVYNPMIVSVYYSLDLTGDNNYPVAGSVDANTSWTLATTNAYAKSSVISIDKAVDDKEAEVTKDTVTFTVTGKIPSYSDEYNTGAEGFGEQFGSLYTIKDIIVNGLEYTNTAPIVTVGGSTLSENNQYEYTLDTSNKLFTIKFKNSYILSLAGADTNRAVVITYQAKLTPDAIQQVGENKVELIYSKKPGATATVSDTEYVYTFELNGILKKIGQDSDKNGLAGAIFSLYRAYNKDTKELSDLFDSYTTKKENGFDIYFGGLDSDRTYYLKETKAPSGYSVNEKVYTITFNDLTYDEVSKKLTGYSVYVDGVKASSVSYGQKAESSTNIPNTKITELPSTGGIGTTIFTVGGCLIMITAAALFFINCRKASK